MQSDTAEVAGIAPREVMDVGETRAIQGTRAKPYKIERHEDHYSCECPSWLYSGGGNKYRTCKHLKALLGDAYENARCSSKLKDGSDDEDPSPVKKRKRAAAKPRKAKEKVTKAKKSAYVPEVYDEEEEDNDLLLPRGVMLAEKWDLESDKDPAGWHASEKLDGVRAHWTGEQLQSRNGKRFDAPKSLTDRLPRDVELDGELFKNERDAFDVTSGTIRRGARDESRWQEISYLVFDVIGSPAPVEDRWKVARKLVPDGEMSIDAVIASKRSCISLVPQTVCKGKDHLMEMLHEVQEVGGEGLMLREPRSKYVSGRSSVLLKVKTFYTAYALVIGHTEGRGRLKDSCGALQLQMADGTTFDCGSGLTDELRAAYEPAVGSIVSYNFQELSLQGKPRFPTYKGISVDKTAPRDAEVRSINLRDKKAKKEKRAAEEAVKQELKGEGSSSVKRE